MGKIQSKVARLTKLLLIEPYRIIGLWSNGETRINDFTEEVKEWQNSPSKELKKLASPRTFKTAFVKDGTLAFSGSKVYIPGITSGQPIDFDRRKLYADSKLIGTSVSYEEAIRPQKKRLENRKRRTSAVEHLEHKLSDSDSFNIVPAMIKKIDTRVKQLVAIGGELIELE
ncbi:hypothetical protein [Spirosoma fluviale]|uniref:Uncharacterized protein n=1 Tax=Spirosoma fluviale TaxID=1597977 RepID=A0A286FE10_9BACT|nr:hypothetical protein [Spirosoma fluviale]SOD81336.1 hypothetical protein SAMN06269250_1757 [Spirosoma fluviale]